MKNQAIIDALVEVKNNNSNNELLPEEVVEAAKSAASPLHNHFTWDDTIAAHQHRLWQARQLIKVVVQVEETPVGNVEVPVFVSLSSDRHSGRGYKMLVEVLTDDEKRTQLLEDAKNEMERFIKKYKDLTELSKVFDEMNTVLN